MVVLGEEGEKKITIASSAHDARDWEREHRLVSTRQRKRTVVRVISRSRRHDQNDQIQRNSLLAPHECVHTLGI